MDGLELLAGADVEQAGVVFLERFSGLGGSDEDLPVLFVGFKNPGDDLGDIEVSLRAQTPSSVSSGWKPQLAQPPMW